MPTAEFPNLLHSELKPAAEVVADQVHSDRYGLNNLGVQCQRELEKGSKLFNTIHPDTGKHRALLVSKYHLRPLSAVDRLWFEVRRIVPGSGSHLEPLVAVEVERFEVLWAHVVSDVGWCE